MRGGTRCFWRPDVFFKALACDYDGTLAFEDRIPPPVREALERARKAGLRLLLVTGRTYFELTRICDCLELFDAVVAENGAVLYYPGSAMIRDQGPRVAGSLLAELDRHKWSGSRREKARAKSVLKKIAALGLSMTPVSLRPGVDAMALDAHRAGDRTKP